MDCGKTFTARVDRKTKKILEGIYWGNIPYVNRSWSQWIPPEKRQPVSRWARFWGRFIWWIEDDPAFKCLHPLWKRPLLILQDSITEHIHKKEQVEMWTCPSCALKLDL